MATFVADSYDVADVQIAVNAASAGDIVQIPTGDGAITWADPLSITEGITLEADGSYAIDGSYVDTGTWPLVITMDRPDLSGISVAVVDAAKRVRITGISFTGETEFGTTGAGTIVFGATNLAPWRVDNCRFQMEPGNAVACTSSQRMGLVDHCYFYSTDGNAWNTIVTMEQSVDGNGNAAWTDVIVFGTGYFTIIENCVFWKNTATSAAATNITDAQAGGKFVVRYCYLKNCHVGCHGADSGAPQRSAHVMEIYNNIMVWDLPADRYHCAILGRGGTQLVYNNDVTNYQFLWKSIVYRARTAYGVFGDADGTEVHDGNLGGDYPAGYQALDQAGRGQASGATLATVQPQAESKCRIWSNTLTNTGSVTNYDPLWVVDGRDYEYSADETAALPGYTPYTYPHPLQWEPDSFDGASWGDWSNAQFPYEVVNPSRHVSMFF